MSKATVELDFFGMAEKDIINSPKSQFQKFLHCQRSFRDIQSGISKINPELLKSVIVSGSANQSFDDFSKKSFSVPSSPTADHIIFPVLPVYVPTSRPLPDNLYENAPMTIFYHGTVSVFDVPRDKAEDILKIASERSFKAAEPGYLIPNAPLHLSSGDQSKLVDSHDLNRYLPIKRNKSLQRFLEKRKERLTLASPYKCSN